MTANASPTSDERPTLTVVVGQGPALERWRMFLGQALVSSVSDLREAIQAGAPVSVEVKSLRPGDRLPWLRFGRELGAQVRLVFVNTAKGHEKQLRFRRSVAASLSEAWDSVARENVKPTAHQAPQRTDGP